MKSFLICHSEMSCDKKKHYCSLKAIILQNLSFLTDCSPPKGTIELLEWRCGGGPPHRSRKICLYCLEADWEFNENNKQLFK